MANVTIIVPLFNAQNYLDKLIPCLENQVYKDFKVVFIDDASQDDTVTELKKRLVKSKLAYEILELKNNKGAGFARNIGMKNIEGKYYTFLDADDWISDNYLDELVKVADDKGADIVFSSGVKINAKGKEKTHYNLDLYEKYLDDKEALMCASDYGPCGKLFSSELWGDDTNFPVGIRCEDLPSVVTMISKGKAFSVSKKSKYYYFQSNNSRSRSDGRFFNDIFASWQILQKRISNNEIVVEYHFLESIMYGLIMNAILHKESDEIILDYIGYAKERYPRGRCNKYFKLIHPLKRLFITLAYFEQIYLLRFFVKIVKR